MSLNASPSAHLARLLTRTALPLLQPPHSLPFRASTLSVASASLPAPHTPSEPYSERTIHALYPSPPSASTAGSSSSQWSLKGFLIGNGGSRSRSRHELIALAQGKGTASVGGEREKTGPARALVEEWLRAGREHMKEKVKASGKTGEAAYRLGMEERLQYNTTVSLQNLPEAFALLTAPRASPLNNPLELLPVPNPAPHFSHVAHIAQDLAKAAGSDAQGTAWYLLRLRLSTIYLLSELHLLSPLSPSTSPSNSEEITVERLEGAIALSRSLFDQSQALCGTVKDAGLYAEWVAESWRGIIRSAGV